MDLKETEFPLPTTVTPKHCRRKTTFQTQTGGVTNMQSLHDIKVEPGEQANRATLSSKRHNFLQRCLNTTTQGIETVQLCNHKELNAMGTIDEVKGRVKKAAGDLTNNDKLKREGKADQASGKVKDAIDGVSDKVKGAVDGARKKR
jgi:uncharacterized protein YjbJ (UPF0337 family)